MDRRTSERRLRREMLMSQWRAAGQRLREEHPTWSRVAVARAIQRSPLGQKEPRELPYSLSYIMAAFRGMRFGDGRSRSR